jgi:hypothetical protein
MSYAGSAAALIQNHVPLLFIWVMERQLSAEMALLRRMVRDARGRLSRCAVRVARQRKLVEELHGAQHAVGLAQSLLEEYEKALTQCVVHHERLRAELGALHRLAKSSAEPE